MQLCFASRCALGLAGCVLGVFAPPSASLAADTPQPLTGLGATVRAMYSANRDAIRSIQYDYTFSLNDNQWLGRYRRQGERFYYASVADTPGGFGVPAEVGWDGRQATRRLSVRSVTVSGRKEKAYQSCATPEDGLGECVNAALGLVPSSRISYNFQSGRELQWGGKDCIELTWSTENPAGTLVTRHAREFGYWPVSMLLVGSDGSKIQELQQVEYTTQQVDGNTGLSGAGIRHSLP